LRLRAKLTEEHQTIKQLQEALESVKLMMSSSLEKQKEIHEEQLKKLVAHHDSVMTKQKETHQENVQNLVSQHRAEIQALSSQQKPTEDLSEREGLPDKIPPKRKGKDKETHEEPESTSASRYKSLMERQKGLKDEETVENLISKKKKKELKELLKKKKQPERKSTRRSTRRSTLSSTQEKTPASKKKRTMSSPPTENKADTNQLDTPSSQEISEDNEPPQKEYKETSLRKSFTTKRKVSTSEWIRMKRRKLENQRKLVQITDKDLETDEAPKTPEKAPVARRRVSTRLAKTKAKPKPKPKPTAKTAQTTRRRRKTTVRQNQAKKGMDLFKEKRNVYEFTEL